MKIAEKHKEDVLRIVLDLQGNHRPNIFHIVDRTCLSKINIEQKFDLNDESSGFYLFALSTEAENESKIMRSLKKIQSGNENMRPERRITKEDNEEAPIMPVYIGYSGKLSQRFINHAAYNTCLDYMESKLSNWNDKYHIYLLVVVMDKVMAKAMETLMLCNYDFAINIEDNNHTRMPFAVDDFFGDEELRATKTPVPGQQMDLHADVTQARTLITSIPVKVASIFTDPGPVPGPSSAPEDGGATSGRTTRKRTGLVLQDATCAKKGKEQGDTKD